MFLNAWSIGLSISVAIVVVMGVVAGRTAWRVLRFWDPASDSNRQIRLESEIWLTSTLVEYMLGFQIITLVVFVLAADQFSRMIVGAMCATGSLLANAYGIPTLTIKLAGVFLYGFWIVLHQLDIRSETYPLVRLKYIYLLCLLPILLVDATLQTLYIAGLRPDIITSCCGVVFDSGVGTTNLLGNIDQSLLLALFYGTAILLALSSSILLRRWSAILGLCATGLWVWFFGLALVAITVVFSSYIYAMPYHRCPFCILKPEYHSIGFVLYGSLLIAAFAGISAGLVSLCGAIPNLKQPVRRYQDIATRTALLLLLLFSATASYHWLAYRFMGGEH